MWAFDGHGGNGLQLEKKNGLTFSRMKKYGTHHGITPLKTQDIHKGILS